MKFRIKMNKEVEVEIAKEDFEAYEEVRKSGKTNMYDIGNVCKLSGLEGR